MVDKFFPGDVESTDRIFPTTPVGAGEKGESPLATQPFSSFMKQGAVSPMETAGKSSMISPFQMMQGQPPLAQAPSMDTLVAQVNNVQSTMGDINNQLTTPNLKLKASTKYLLKSKLTDANDTLRTFNAKIGANVPEEPPTSSFSGPLGKFFGYLTDGQQQMDSAKQQLQSLKDKGGQLSPGDFLLVQVKLNKAQQLLEFSSVLLSNAVSDFKQLMQVQL
jgi:predicted PhzF superfamily epimerase YddE/YHI9